MHDTALYEFLNLPLDRAERFLIDIAGLELVCVVRAVVVDRDDVLALFHRAVRRNVQNSLSFSEEDLAVRNLVVALVGFSQPVRDGALDHPIPLACAGESSRVAHEMPGQLPMRRHAPGCMRLSRARRWP